ncbi:PepSY domain-containing protein [Paenibacillus sp. 102]|uniref:PepSY domain-containing protein n=1 Tax=Paenibacillus sp. 102 TaxID=3120823 RepID=UPI0031BA966F
MNRKWKILLLVCFAIVSVAFVSQRIVANQSVEILTEKEAQKIVTTQYPGKVEKMKLSKEGEKNVYKVMIVNKQGSYEVIIDAQNGEIMSAKEIALSKDITAEKAEEIALQKVTGAVKQTLLENRGGKGIYVVKVETAPNQMTVIEVEKETGKVNIFEKKSTKVTEQQAREIAVQQVPGEVKQVTLQQKDGKVLYQIEVEKNPNEKIMVEIEEATGTTLGTHPVSQVQTIITEEQAKNIAGQRFPGGSISAVKLIASNGESVYQVIIKNQSQTVDIRVHAITGEVESTTTIDNDDQPNSQSNDQSQNQTGASDDDQDDQDDNQEDDEE